MCSRRRAGMERQMVVRSPHLQKGQVELLAAQLHAGPHGRLAPAREAGRRACIAAGGAHVCVALGGAAERVGFLVAVVHDILGGQGCRWSPLHGREGVLLALLLLLLLPAACRPSCGPLRTPAVQHLITEECGADLPLKSPELHLLVGVPAQDGRCADDLLRGDSHGVW